MNSGIDQIDTVRATVERAVKLAQAGDPVQAEAICRESLQQYPDDGNLLCLLGTLLVRQRRPADAERPLRRAIDRHPDFLRAQEELGNALMAQGNIEEATTCFRQVIGLEPDNAEAQFKLSKLLEKSGHLQEATVARRAASEQAPHQEARAAAAQFINTGRFAEAEKIYRDLLAHDPNKSDYLRVLGRLAMEQKQFGDAVVLLRRAAEITPQSVLIWNDLAKALLEREAYDDAIDAIRHSLEIETDITASHLLHGNALTRAFRFEEAADAYQAGLKIQPDHTGCLAGLGHVTQALGRHAEAINAYRTWINAEPTAGEAWWSLAGLSGQRFDDAEIETMQTHARDKSLPEASRISFWFALARAYEGNADYDRSFEFYGRGNAAQRMHESYDAVETEIMHERIIATFTPEFFHRTPAINHKDATPIFIVGLPRSGSTLIEQILASHSQVDGTQELPALGRVIQSINRRAPDESRYPEALLNLDPVDFTNLGRQYLDATRRYRTGRPLFTDKMPNNFPGIGLIRLILPQAKIIDARRHPLDSCIGSYKQLFADGQAFTYDLGELAEYYLQYRKIMAYWQETLPGQVLGVHYEDLVTDPEPEIRRLLDYCGLPWEEQCLRFYETERTINTASAEQVRRPLYTTSMHRWRHFEVHLGELIEILAPILETLPADQLPALLSTRSGGT